MSPTVLHPDPFNAALLESPALPVTDEQKMYVKEVLDISSSDSRFAQKAYDAISRILTGGNAVVSSIIQLVPASVVIGAPSFDLHVKGAHFSPQSVIYFAGLPEPTVFVSDTELTTGINMPLWLGPDTVEVKVLTNGVLSDPMDFTFLPGVTMALDTDARPGVPAGMSTGHMSLGGTTNPAKVKSVPPPPDDEPEIVHRSKK